MVVRSARSTVAAFAATVLLLAALVTLLTRPASAAQATGGPARSDKAAAAQEQKGHGKPSPAATTSPQPKSNADMNKGGANNGGDCGAYCSTRDGSPSGNGNGKGEAKGKPCAGCVGKADNKNPPGQQPDGTDHNAGYECDRNHGIGRTNPAHTGCTPAPTVQPTVTPTTPPPCVPTETEPCGTPTACVPTEAEPCGTPTPCVPAEGAPCGNPTPTPSVLPTTLTQTPAPETATPPAQVKGVKLVRPAATAPKVLGGRLPKTGSPVPVALLLLVGFGTIALGITVTVATPASR
ncbi:MAG TPA: hypothetical protein VFQ85_13510 [Mycobacteriales bacterium]|jgi:hypothetical protein|nr:hypothetical protein [Mycobacteriales bacterium]